MLLLNNIYIKPQFFFNYSSPLMKVKFFKSCSLREFSKLRKVRANFHKWEIREHIGMWVTQHKSQSYIPKDVPKGHLVVYVGENCKRFVIKVDILNHPPFKALLDHAEDVFGFTNDSKLIIPCNENIFLNILHNAAPRS